MYKFREFWDAFPIEIVIEVSPTSIYIYKELINQENHQQYIKINNKRIPDLH